MWYTSDAYAWYEDQFLGLGMEFLRCLEATLLAAQRYPMIYPVVHESYHRALVRRTRYAVRLNRNVETVEKVIYP